MIITMKTEPNILMTGTPCTGKSTLAQMIEERTDLRWICIGDLAKENNYFDGYDEERHCPILDEEKVLDHLEDEMGAGGKIVDFHASEFFPERFFDIVFILRTDNTILYDRMVARGYSGKKLEDNIQCEIMAVVRDEAVESYKKEIVHELDSNTFEDLESNAEKIVNWITCWKQNNGIIK